jgi:hypothetical protein
VIDFIHVLEYVWKAAWCLFGEGDPAAERWVRTQGLRILEGHSDQVAATLRRNTTGMDPHQRATAQACARYLTNTGPYLNYPTALAQGWPIATGVIEGACRHLIKDRMDLTGARWDPAQRRSRPQTQSPAQQQRHRRLLELPPHPRKTPSTRGLLPERSDPPSLIITPQKRHTQSQSSPDPKAGRYFSTYTCSSDD